MTTPTTNLSSASTSKTEDFLPMSIQNTSSHLASITTSTLTSLRNRDQNNWRIPIDSILSSLKDCWKKSEYVLALTICKNALKFYSFDTHCQDKNTLGEFYLMYAKIVQLTLKEATGNQEVIDLCQKGIALGVKGETLINLYEIKIRAHVLLKQLDLSYSSNEEYLKIEGLTDDLKALALLRRARFLLENPDSRITAIETCNEVLALKPQTEVCAEAALLKAKAYRAMNTFEGVLKAADEALKNAFLSSSTICGFIELLYLYSQDENFAKEAENRSNNFFQSLLKMESLLQNEANPVTLCRVVKILNQYGSFDLSIKLCQKALKEAKDAGLINQLSFQLGLASEDKNPNLAIRSYADALNSKPSEEQRKKIIEHCMRLSKKMVNKLSSPKQEI